MVRWRVSMPIVVAWLLAHILQLMAHAARWSLVGQLIGRSAWLRRRPDGTIRQGVKLWVVVNLLLYMGLRFALIWSAAKTVQTYVRLRCWPLLREVELQRTFWLWRYGQLPGQYRKRARRVLRRTARRYPWAAGLYAVIAAPHGSADDLSPLYDTKTKAWLGALITATGKPWFDVTSPLAGGGATGNGSGVAANVAAETFAIQSAISIAQGKGPVFFPKPAVAYRVNMLTLQSGTVLLGFDLPTLILANGANTNLLTFADVVQTDTQIIGLSLDGNGANQTAFSDIIGIIAGSVTLSFNRLVVASNTLQNAYRHGCFTSEATAGQSNNPKWIYHNTVNGHGLGTTGFGIYEDYSGNTINEGNFVTNTGTFDCIELGHAGPGSLATLGSLTCVYNITKGGQINYPFSDNARIEGNFVLNSKISNDQNTANNVALVGNTVWAPGTTNADTGLQNAGAFSLIEGNYASVGQLSGCGNVTGSMSFCRVQGNVIASTNAGNSGNGIYLGNTGAGASDSNTCLGNVVSGHFIHGIVIIASSDEVASNQVSLSGATDAIFVVGSATSGIVSQNGNIHDNALSGAATAITLPVPGADGHATGLRIRNNKGYNPLGVAAIAVGGSPFTYTNSDYVDEAVYIDGGTVTTVVKNGITIANFAGAASHISVWLEPEEALTVTYTAAPTMNKDRK